MQKRAKFDGLNMKEDHGHVFELMLNQQRLLKQKPLLLDNLHQNQQQQLQHQVLQYNHRETQSGEAEFDEVDKDIIEDLDGENALQGAMANISSEVK
jgi:hypothetical protein